MNPTMHDALNRSDRQFNKERAQIKENFNGQNALSSSDFGLSIKERYIEELEKIAHIIFENLNIKDRLASIFSDLFFVAFKKLEEQLALEITCINGGSNYGEISPEYQRIKDSYIYKIENEKRISSASPQTVIYIHDSPRCSPIIGNNNSQTLVENNHGEVFAQSSKSVKEVSLGEFLIKIIKNVFSFFTSS